MPAIEALLSLIGPAYLAYYGFTVSVAVSWAILCAALWVWNNRPGKRNGGVVRSRSASLMFFILVAACYVAAHMGVYLLARHLARLWA
ncbi:hypothetical protein [Mesorhizobium sp. B2-7-1]|uniref:hypothetical protein n=1 Tax=Mesorhizobium sp. B2-7-1 TaxID=2589909 RepID=UPI00112EE019|nr:hypothetical protein [Mesorhizobium sp. B2-7-1]TPJ67783.1 hypothetical protein FJ471_12665 [Mesorhizobium sp. B2-7-1]